MAGPPASPGPGFPSDGNRAVDLPTGQPPTSDPVAVHPPNWAKVQSNLNAPPEYAPNWVPNAPPIAPKQVQNPPQTNSPPGINDAISTAEQSSNVGSTYRVTPAPSSSTVVIPKPAPALPSEPDKLFPAVEAPTGDTLITADSGIQISLDGEEDEEADHIAVAIDAAPPWLISLAVHMVMIVVLGLLALSTGLMPPLNLEVTFSESLGDQLEEETFDMADMSLDTESLETPSDMTLVDDPLASPHNEAIDVHDQLLASSQFEAPNIGLALSGREPGMKKTLLLAYGGTKTTEAAVANALEWLKRNQLKNGSWRLDGPYKDGSAVTNPVAATAMALLAFQGAGFTHQSTRNMVDDSGKDKREVDYRRVVERGWDRLLTAQSEDGSFFRKGGVDHPHHKLYSQAQVTIAICELYGMTRDEKLRRPAQRAVNYCCKIQDEDGVSPDGGWKYDPNRDSDLSVTGWFVMALQSARMAGLDVPSDVFAKIDKFLNSVTDDGSFYSYMPGYAPKPSLTAEGLLCRQYLGWQRTDERMIEGVEYLADNPVDWSDTNTYYWYYATQVMHHMEGDYWYDWNKIMAQQIPAKQVKSGPEKGSWSPDGDIWGQGGGRLYMTCLCTYMLEVYYRHLPIYSKAF